jgi:hypothetical protein
VKSIIGSSRLTSQVFVFDDGAYDDCGRTTRLNSLRI